MVCVGGKKKVEKINNRKKFYTQVDELLITLLMQALPICSCHNTLSDKIYVYFDALKCEENRKMDAYDLMVKLFPHPKYKDKTKLSICCIVYLISYSNQSKKILYYNPGGFKVQPSVRYYSIH